VKIERENREKERVVEKRRRWERCREEEKEERAERRCR
jgi:hypothetical protein